MTAPALSEPDVVAVRADAVAGRAVTVWFTAAAVGVPAGGSAKVVAVGEPPEGDFIQVRPAGTRDTMFCAPNELTRTRPARGRAAAGTTGLQPAPKQSAPKQPAGPQPAPKQPAVEPAAPKQPAVKQPAAKATPAKPPTPTAPATSADPEPPATPAPKPPPAAPRAAGPRRRADRSGELAVSLRATADGEWTAEVLVASKRVVGPVPLPAADVATAARSLPPPVAEAIESSLEATRRRQRDRVEQLRAELDAAQRVLDALAT